MRRLIAGCVLAILGAVLPAGAAAAQEPPPHVLVFSTSYGFHHSSIEYGNGVLAQLAAETGEFTVEFSSSPADLGAAKLAQVDLVLFNSTTGRMPVSQQQRDEFERWLGCGGGFMGVHASADHNYGWPAYAELEHGDHVSYDPIDLRGIGALDLRVEPGALGGTIQARADSPDGPLVGSVSIPGAGAARSWTTVRMPVTDPGGAHALFLVFQNVLVPQNPVLPGSMLRLNFIELAGSG